MVALAVGFIVSMVIFMAIGPLIVASSTPPTSNIPFEKAISTVLTNMMLNPTQKVMILEALLNAIPRCQFSDLS